MNALGFLIANDGFGNGHMGGSWGWLVAAAMMGGMGWMMWSMMRGGRHREGPAEDPVDVINIRYARGEITTEEHQERLRTIENSRR